MASTRQLPEVVLKCTISGHATKRDIIDRIKAALVEASAAVAKGSKPPCVVLDIDDTVIKSTKQCRAIRELIEIYKFALAMRIKVFIITARIDQPGARDQTMIQLLKAGIDTFEKMYMMPTSVYEDHLDWSKYKYAARQEISSKYKIVLNAGDSWTDLYLSSNYQDNVWVLNETVKIEKIVQGFQFALIEGLPLARWSLKLPNAFQE